MEVALSTDFGHDEAVTFLVLSLLVVSAIVGCLMTAALCRIGLKVGTLDSPGGAGDAKVLRPVPNIGGIAVAWPLILFLGLGGVLVLVCPQWLVGLVPSLETWLPRLEASAPMAIAFGAAAGLLHIVGLIDDRRELQPWPKLVIQIAIALALSWGFDIRLLQTLDDTFIAGAALSILLTTAWIVVVTNAMNFLDNMDGLTGGVTVVAGSILMVTALIGEQWFVAATLAVLTGSTLGFLFFNLPPARIFLGDGGSLVIGLALAVLTVRITYVEEGVGTSSAWYGVLMPLAVLAIPLYDLIGVTLLRLRQGRHPFQGDKQHFSHRLVKRGLSPRRAVLIIWMLAGVTGVIGMLLPGMEPWQAAVAAGQLAFVLCILAVLETGTSA